MAVAENGLFGNCPLERQLDYKRQSFSVENKNTVRMCGKACGSDIIQSA